MDWKFTEVSFGWLILWLKFSSVLKIFFVILLYYDLESKPIDISSYIWSIRLSKWSLRTALSYISNMTATTIRIHSVKICKGCVSSLKEKNSILLKYTTKKRIFIYHFNTIEDIYTGFWVYGCKGQILFNFCSKLCCVKVAVNRNFVKNSLTKMFAVRTMHSSTAWG